MAHHGRVVGAREALRDCADGGEQRRVLDSLDGTRLVEQPIPPSLGEGRAEDVVHAGVVAQVERPAQPREPHGDGEHDQGREVAGVGSSPPWGRGPGHTGSSRRAIDIAEMNNEENSVLQPMITSVAANDAHSGRGKGSRSERIHSTTTATSMGPAQERQCSSRSAGRSPARIADRSRPGPDCRGRTAGSRSRSWHGGPGSRSRIRRR